MTQDLYKARKAAFRGVIPKKNNSLIGDFIVDSEPGYLTPYDVRKILNKEVPLVFVEELNVGSRSRAEFERESESDAHRELVSEMVGVLQRQGFRIYPGGVGIDGEYVMADLLAVSPSGEPLLVECLTGASIKMGGHNKKIKLTKHMSTCFVGPLPDDFCDLLPGDSYAIQYPRSAKTNNGQWIPDFYLKDRLKEKFFIASFVGGKKVKRYEITLPNLNLKEDVSSFLWAALAEYYLSGPTISGIFHSNTHLKGATVKIPGAKIGSIPFSKFGLSSSVFSVVYERSEARIKLGSSPLIVEIRGDFDAFNLILDWLKQVGFPLQVTE